MCIYIYVYFHMFIRLFIYMYTYIQNYMHSLHLWVVGLSAALQQNCHHGIVCTFVGVLTSSQGQRLESCIPINTGLVRDLRLEMTRITKTCEYLCCRWSRGLLTLVVFG